MPVSFTEGSCTTHFSSPTLADLMTMLPELHPTHLSQNKASKLKHLRLVSKEMGSMVHAAVHSCSVNLGEGGASPSPEQLVRLLGRAHLKELTVNVTVTAGVSFSGADTDVRSALVFTEELAYAKHIAS